MASDGSGEPAVAAGPAKARESAGQALAPGRKGLCIAVCHDGLSPSRVRALAAAREAGAQTALITAGGGPPPPGPPRWRAPGGTPPPAATPAFTPPGRPPPGAPGFTPPPPTAGQNSPASCPPGPPLRV